MTNPLIPNLDAQLAQAQAFIEAGRQFRETEQELRSLHEQIAQLVARRQLLATQITAARQEEAKQISILARYDVPATEPLWQSNPILLALVQGGATPVRAPEQVRPVAPAVTPRTPAPESTPAPQVVAQQAAPSAPLWREHPEPPPFPEPVALPTPGTSSGTEQGRSAPLPPTPEPALAATPAVPDEAEADGVWAADAAEWAEDLLPAEEDTRAEEDTAQAPAASGLNWKEALTPAPAAPFRAPAEAAASAPAGAFKNMVQNLFGGNGTNA